MVFRILGCGNNVTSCRNVFWLDRNNDFDVPLSPQAVINTFENDGCNTNLVGKRVGLFITKIRLFIFYKRKIDNIIMF